MRESDPFSNNLLSRLFSYTPREGEKRERRPLEDFCTEALAWCLLSSEDFSASFLELIGIPTAMCRSPIEVHTQRRYSSRLGEICDEDEETFGEQDAGRFDLVICSKGSQEFAVIVEVKAARSEWMKQPERYWNRLKDPKMEFGKFSRTQLVTLTPYKAPTELKDVVSIHWSDINHLLLEFREKIQIEKRLVFDYFSKFLRQKGLYMEKITPIPNEILKHLPNLSEAFNGLAQIITALLEQRVVKAKHSKKPTWEFGDTPENDGPWSWLGVHTSYPLNGYVGFGFNNKYNKVVLWAEVAINGDIRNDEHITKLKGSPTVSYDDSERTWIMFRQPLDGEYNGQSQKILSWFSEQIEECSRYLKGKT